MIKRILKAAGKKQFVTYKGNSISISEVFAKTLQMRRECHVRFQMLKKKKIPAKSFLPGKLFRIEGVIKFSK